VTKHSAGPARSQEEGPTALIEAAEQRGESATAPGSEGLLSFRRTLWGVGPFRFRFRLANFRPGRDLAQRHFNIAEAMVLFLAAYLASHVLGLVRQIMFNTIFGAGPEANAYYAAFRLPDTLFTLIAGGALIQAFIPVFVSYEKERGQRELWHLTSLVLNVLLVAMTGLVLVGEITAPAFVSHWLVPGYPPAEQALTASLTRVMLLQPLLLGIGSLASAILYSRRQFLLPTLSIAVYNVGLIGGLLVALAVPGVGIYGPTVGVVVAAAIQTLIQVPGLLKQGFAYTFAWDIKHEGLLEVLSLLIPNIIAVGIVSAGTIVETAFISYLHDQASLAAIHNAQLLFDLPITFLGQTLGLAALPQMSRLAAAGRYASLRALAMKIVGAAVLISIPTALLLYLFGKPVIHVFLEHGAFSRHASLLAMLALLGYAVGLPGRIASDLLARSFYAIKNAVAPLVINLLFFAVRIGLILLLLGSLSGKYVILAIPLSAAAATTMEAGALFLLLFYYFLRKVQTSNRVPDGMDR
jgi:putative peptidoglycan lipid II flippase